MLYYAPGMFRELVVGTFCDVCLLVCWTGEQHYCTCAIQMDDSHLATETIHHATYSERINIETVKRNTYINRINSANIVTNSHQITQGHISNKQLNQLLH